MGRDMMRLRRGILLNTPHEETASGAVATFKTDVPKLKECVVSIEPVQEGSGDPSPDNVRPISGWSEAKVTGTGKNFAILSQQILDNDRTQNGITWKATSKSSFHVSGTATGSSFLTVGYGVTSPYLRFLKAGTYTVSCNFPANCSVYIYGFAIGSGATSTTTLVSGVRANSPRTFTITDDWMINIQAQIASGVTIDDEINVQVEPGTTASVYEAYRGVTVTIDLDGTRYGGMLNVLTGVLMVDRASIIYDGSENWMTYSPDNYDSFCFLVFNNNKAIGSFKSICDQYKNVSVSWGADGNGKYGVYSDHATLPRLYFRPPYDGFEKTVTAWKEWLSTNPLQLVCDLATPFTVQLTPAQLRAIKGQNNIFADCGDVAVKYWKH